MDETQIIQEQADKVVASGVLGRSRSYARLFEYLTRNSIEGRHVKELEIASEVFSKRSDFDPSQDSMVRVYAHNLRQKLKQFYEGPGAEEPHRIYIPRGEYRLAVESPAGSADMDDTPTVAANGGRLRLALAAVALLVVGAILGFAAADKGLDPDEARVAESPFWSELLDDEIPVLVVVGDYYIFAELNAAGDVARFVREFSINSRDDLSRYLMRNPELTDRYQDLDVRYLAQSTAAALRDIFRVLYTSDKEVSVVSMSDLNPSDFKTHHVVYVGYLSALDKLFDFVFASSSLAIGETFDELWNLDTGETYTSEAGRPDDYRNYRDYGFFSTFPGPNGNQFVVIAGTRDEGVLQSVQLVTEPMYVASAELGIPEADTEGVAFEMLYEVTGFDRTNIDAMLVHAAPLDVREIWRGDLLQLVGE